MKKLLFWILTLLWIWFSFCSAWELTAYCSNWSYDNCYNYLDVEFPSWDYVFDFSFLSWPSCDSFSVNISDPYYINVESNKFFISLSSSITSNVEFWCIWASVFDWNFSILYNFIPLFTWSSSSFIDVYYNNWNSVETITCDWTQAIDIRWLSTITSTNTFTPYYNISYTDEDNQKLTESYSKSNLYLSGWLFKKTYTWDNERILTDTIESPNSSFSWYLPTFEITWWIEEVTESWNIFNNFAENSLKFTLSNIPSYIQYVILLMLLFFILWFIRKFRGK